MFVKRALMMGCEIATNLVKSMVLMGLASIISIVTLNGKLRDDNIFLQCRVGVMISLVVVAHPPGETKTITWADGTARTTIVPTNERKRKNGNMGTMY